MVREDGQVLIVRRSESDSHEPNMWEMPGGKIDPGQPPEESLRREIFEETGLGVEEILPNMLLVESFVLQEGKYAGSLYVSVVCVAKVIEGDVVLSNEHSEYKWVQFSELMNYPLTRATINIAIRLQPLFS
jgi:8-oxo-dGTP diphosphatase